MSENNPDTRYLELAEKWLNGTITPEEAQEYAEWYNSFYPDDTLEVPTHWAKNKEEHRKKILRQINRTRRRVIPVSQNKIYKAAAAILVIAFGIAYFYKQQKGSHESTAVVKTPGREIQDIKAGTTGAVLTLANGKKIILDTAANGNLINSSKTNIIKSNGSVVFSSSVAEFRPEYNMLVTPRGRQEQLVLSDGTKVWLNAESSVKFPTVFARHQREVEITGEAYFEVAKDPTKPFFVNVNGSSIEVLGTHFNIMAYSNESALETTLLEGLVKFKKGNHLVLLKPGQQSLLLPNEEIKLIPNADVDLAVAWKNGMQAFSGADIKTMMRQVERWYDVDVEFKGDIPLRTFSGEIPRNVNLSELLKLLAVAKIHFSIDTDKRKLIVMP